MIGIFIVDDHRILRDGLRALLDGEADMEVAAETGNDQETVQLILKGEGDLVLLDVNLPDLDGLEVLRQVRARKNRIPILVLTMHQEEYLAFQLSKNGANGVVSKQEAGEELLNAIWIVARGRRYLSTEMREKLAYRLLGNSGGKSHELLSPQERTILRLIAGGQTVSKIAEELHLSPSTVTTYRRRIKDKLGIEGSTAKMVRYALDHGLG